jgi:hypothetical protein
VAADGGAERLVSSIDVATHPRYLFRIQILAIRDNGDDGLVHD